MSDALVARAVIISVKNNEISLTISASLICLDYYTCKSTVGDSIVFGINNIRKLYGSGAQSVWLATYLVLWSPLARCLAIVLCRCCFEWLRSCTASGSVSIFEGLCSTNYSKQLPAVR